MSVPGAGKVQGKGTKVSETVNRSRNHTCGGSGILPENEVSCGIGEAFIPCVEYAPDLFPEGKAQGKEYVPSLGKIYLFHGVDFVENADFFKIAIQPSGCGYGTATSNLFTDPPLSGETCGGGVKGNAAQERKIFSIGVTDEKGAPGWRSVILGQELHAGKGACKVGLELAQGRGMISGCENAQAVGHGSPFLN
jgi:hypothetical protein